MIRTLQIIKEAALQALQQLSGNKLRTLLSLLGISVGIFCIIAVFASVDSLERNVKGSLETLGSDVVYITKLPWANIPRKDFWEYMRRPNPSYQDFKFLKNRITLAENVAYAKYLFDREVKYGDEAFNASFVTVTDQYVSIIGLEFEAGRFYSFSEYNSGANVVVIGHDVAANLFGNLDPIGKQIRFKGNKLRVIGVIKKRGKEMVNVMNFDDVVLLTVPLARRVANMNTRFFFGGANLLVKAKEGVRLDDLKAELNVHMRAIRRLSPKDKENFSLNTLSMITNILSGFFGVLNVAGFIIGGFAMLVGMVSIANIMFVSVKERTRIIGIKKALGAKRWFILLEFLVESVVLSLLGGVLGLVLVRIAVVFISKAFAYDVYLSRNNVVWGLVISVVVGILAGILPAFFAARLDPVEAIRH